MACGDRYASLIANSFGATANDPCGTGYCNDADHAAWNASARSLAELVAEMRATWAESGASDPLLDSRFAVYQVSMLGLVEPSGFALPGTQAERVASVIEIMREGVCLLEVFEDGTKANGGTPTPVPVPIPPKSSAVSRWVWWVVGGVVVVGGVSVLGFYGWQAVKARSELRRFRGGSEAEG